MSLISRGLDYLVLSQTPKGGWTWNGRPHVLLSCRALYALSYRQPAEGSTALKRGVQWLLDLQSRDGSWNDDVDATQSVVSLLLGMDFARGDGIIQKASKWVLENGENFPWSYYLADSKRRESVLAKCREALSAYPKGEKQDSDLVAYILDRRRWPKIYLDEIMGGNEIKNLFVSWMRRGESSESLLYKKYGDGQMFVDESNSSLTRAAFLLDAIPNLPPSYPRTLVGAMTQYLAQRQNEDGGWGYEPSGDSQVNSTAMITSSLIRAVEGKIKWQ